MIRTANLYHIKFSNKFAGLLKNSWAEMPLTVSLAFSGLTLQLYASYMLVKSAGPARIKIPFLNYRIQDTSSP